MPALQRRKNADGSSSTTAIVRVRGFQPTSKTFKAPTARESDALAEAWANEQEATLRSMRASGSGAPEVTRITLRELAMAYLADPDVKQLKAWDGYSDSSRGGRTSTATSGQAALARRSSTRPGRGSSKETGRRRQ